MDLIYLIQLMAGVVLGFTATISVIGGGILLVQTLYYRWTVPKHDGWPIVLIEGADHD